MIRPRNILLASAAFALAACTIASVEPLPAPQAAIPVPAPQPIALAAWKPVNAETGKIVDLGQLQALAESFPESASVQRRLMSAALREKNPDILRLALTRLEAMGYALRPQTFAVLAQVIGETEAAAAKARAETLSAQVGISVPFSTIGTQHRLVEGVAWDDKLDRLYASSVVDRRLFTMDDNRGIIVGGLDAGSLFGMAIDEPRRLLWVASGALEQTPAPETAFRGLIAIDLDRVVPVRRVPAPDGVSLGDVGLGADGTVYASDPMGSGLYRLRQGADTIETLVAPGTLRSPQSIAVHPNGRWLYVPDYAYGIAIVDLTTGQVGRLAAAQPMMLDGTDGLMWFEDGLVAIQNGTNPLRIVRIHLDPPGITATGLTVVEANHPDWGEPTLGQIVGKDLFYVSNPQWDRFGPGGVLKGDAPLRPNPIRVTPLKNELTLPPQR